MGALDRALADLEAGRPWTARDRLRGTNPGATGDPRVLDLLGRACWTMGDRPAAGLAWFLSDRPGSDPDVAAAVAVVRERWPNPVAAAAALGVKAPVGGFAREAQERLTALQQEIRARGGRWDPPASPQGPPRRSSRGGPGRSPGRRREDALGCLGSVLLTGGGLTVLAVFVVGLVESVRAVVGLVSGLL